MKTVKLPKFDPLGAQKSDGVVIEITEDTPEWNVLNSLKDIEKYYDTQASILVDALSHLPQGILEPLIVKLMQQRISLYCGKMGT